MIKEANIKQILSRLQSVTYSDIQSIDMLLEYGFEINQYIAYSGEAMAEAKQLLHNARKAAYLKVEASLDAQGKKWSPMLAKDYVNDCCAKENAYYELCERCNRAATHANSLVITAISALKTELQTLNFQNNR